MKIPNTAFQQLANTPPPTWQRNAIEVFSDKLADPMTLIATPAWQQFADNHAPEWNLNHFTAPHLQAEAVPHYEKKDLLSYVETSQAYFDNYSCTTHLYALKSFGNLHTKQRKFTMGGLWSVF